MDHSRNESRSAEGTDPAHDLRAAEDRIARLTTFGILFIGGALLWIAAATMYLM